MVQEVAGSSLVSHPICYPHANRGSCEPQEHEGFQFSKVSSSEMARFTAYIQRYMDITPRTYSFELSFYTIIRNARQRFCLGTRPEDLANIETIENKSLKKHQAYLKRLERFPLDKAEYYLRLKETNAVNTVKGLSKITGEDWSYIARILKTLDLCDPIKEFLQNNKEDPETLRYFHLRKLLDIVRQGEKNMQLARFRDLIDELEGHVL